MTEKNPNPSSTTSQVPSNVKRSEDLTSRSVTTTGSTASEMVAAQTEAEVKSGFALAQHCPRNEERARANIVQSCKNLRFAEKAIYKKPVGKVKQGNEWVQNYVEGPSIRFAEEVIRNWGNIKIQEIKIYDDTLRRIVRVICYDLQTNIPYSEDIIIEKTVERKNAFDREVVGERTNTKGEKISIVIATDDEVRNKEKALVSKAIRNNGLRLIPSHIIEEAMDIAKDTIRAGVSKDPMAVRRKMVDSFLAIGITVDDLQKYLGHEINKTTEDELVNLKTIYNSIKEGDAKWADYMNVEDAQFIEKAQTAPIDPTKAFTPGDPSTHTSVEQPQKTLWEKEDEEAKAKGGKK